MEDQPINPSRGELKIKLGNSEFQGRVTLDIVRRMETKFGSGIVKIATKLANGDLKIGECASIITPVINAGQETKVTSEKVEKLIFESGFTEGIRVSGEIIAEILQTGEESGNE